MKRTILLVPVLLAAASFAAQADPAPVKSCINTEHSYVAHRLNQHEVFVQSAIGKARPALRLRTTCINLEPAIAIGLSTEFTCIGQGDQVIATTADGHREHCLVSGVLPYVPDKNDLHS